MTIRAVGFDLDYTLAVPERDRDVLLREATAAVDAPDIGREEYLDAHGDHLTGETRAPIFETLLEERGADADPDHLARAYRERVTDALVPVDGVEALLASLRETYRVGLLTNGPSVAQREKVDALGWWDAFDAVLVTGDLDAGKPDERAFAALLESLGSTPAETVYVGDDPAADVAGAAALGCRTVQVVFEGGPDPHPDADVHVARDDLARRLPEILQSLSA